MKQLLTALVLAGALLLGLAPSDMAVAQNVICSTAPPGDSSNRCASTAFVQAAVTGNVPYANISGLPAMTILGSIAGGNAQALTATQVTTFCNVFTTSLSGCVPSTTSATGKWLQDNATWTTSAALTKTDDSNVTLTLSGSPSTALLRALNIAVGWSGLLPVSRGGTGQGSFTANNPLIGNGTGALGQGSRTGNTTVFATSTGTLTPNDCVKIDAGGNLVDSGAGCGAGTNVANTQNFVAGTDFTAGTSTSLTLSSAPTNAQQLLVAFDGVVQAHNTWGLSGAVVTFNAAIPLNVSVVEAQWSTSSTTAGVGSLTDSAGNVASGAVVVAPPFSTAGNTLGPGGACFVKSRAAAILLNLSSCAVVRTGGYATPGDGGDASFVQVGAGTTFLDTFLNCNPCTLVGGSGYTNGTYNGVPVSGGGGATQACVAQVVVSGGAVTQVNFAVPCVTHAVGNVLTTANSNIGGTGSGFSYTVSSISTPKASFTDAGGTLWQYVATVFPNVLQFGCVGDWNGSDGAATNNTNCIWSATAFASNQIGSAAALVNGNQILFPRGSYMTCGGQFMGSVYNFPVPVGVTFTGGGRGVTTLKQCAADPSGTHYIELCDSYMLVGEFGCKVEKMTLDSSQIASGTTGFAVIYSNSGQQFTLADQVEIYAGLKSCIKYEIGKGGAANDVWEGIDCNMADAATNPAYWFNASSTQHILRNSVCASSPSGGAANCIRNDLGKLVVDGLDIEGFVTGLRQNVTNAGDQGSFKNVQQNSTSCSQVVTLVSGNIPGNMIFENVISACPIIINNGQPGGSNWTQNIRGPLMCVSGACAAAVP